MYISTSTFVWYQNHNKFQHYIYNCMSYIYIYKYNVYIYMFKVDMYMAYTNASYSICLQVTWRRRQVTSDCINGKRDILL